MTRAGRRGLAGPPTGQFGASLSGSVFAVTGPRLPALSTPPTPGSFAELDIDDGESVCPTHEPPGVTCEDGMITDLEPDTDYVVTQVQAAAGFAIAPPQRVDSLPYGRPSVAQVWDKPA